MRWTSRRWIWAARLAVPALALAVVALVLAAAWIVQMPGRGAPATDGGLSPAPPSPQSSALSGLASGPEASAGLGGSPFEGAEAAPRSVVTPQADAANAVVTQALNAVTVPVPAATAYVRIDPVPATPVATSRAVETLAPSSSDVTALIAASPWPRHLWGTVACLVERESRGDPLAVGAAGERGLMQAHPVTWPYLARHGIAPDMLFDPATNLRAGYLLYLEAGGFRPWGGGCG